MTDATATPAISPDHQNPAPPDPVAAMVAAAIQAGRQVVAGRTYMTNANGGLDPIEMVKPADQLQDEQVRRIMAFADELNQRVARFKRHTLDDVAQFMDVLAQEYGTKVGGPKGNVTLTSHDKTLQVRLQVQDRLTFGPELQAAKTLIDECLNEWAAEGRPELQVIVQGAFNTDKEGLVNRAALFGLLRVDIAEERWQRAMKALKDSIRIDGSKEHVRFYRRPDSRAPWKAVTIDVADA